MSGTWIVAAAALLGTPPEGGQQEPDAIPPRASSLEITLVPGAWLPRIKGNSSLGPGAASIDLDTQLELDDTVPTVNVELSIRVPEVWEVFIGGFDFSADSTTTFSGSATWGGLVLSDGDPVAASFDITSIAAEMAVALWRPYADGKRSPPGTNIAWDGRPVADLRFSPQLGVRWLDVNQSIGLVGGGTPVSAGGDWVAIYAGFDVCLDYRPREHLPFLRRLRLNASAAIGPAIGGGGGWMFQVRAGVSFHFIEQVGIMIGYRLMEIDVKNDDYEFRGGLQGLFLAASIRF